MQLLQEISVQKRNFFYQIIFCFFLSSPIFSENLVSTYGAKGNIDVSAGFSGLQASNRSGSQQYAVSFLPYVNHFLFNRVFLRYDLGVDMQYQTSGPFTQVNFDIYPGVGIGYTFNIAQNWYLNVSAGYAVLNSWLTYTDAGYIFGAVQRINFYPEIKYLITDRWTASISARFATNIPWALYYSNSLKVLTTIYIGTSYVFK